MQALHVALCPRRLISGRLADARQFSVNRRFNIAALGFGGNQCRVRRAILLRQQGLVTRDCGGLRPQLRNRCRLHSLGQGAEIAARLPHLIQLLHFRARVSHFGFGGGQLGVHFVQLLLGHHFSARAHQPVCAAKCLNFVFRFLNRLPQIFQPRVNRVGRFFVETRLGIRKAFKVGFRHTIGNQNRFFRRLCTCRHIENEGAIHPLGGSVQPQGAQGCQSGVDVRFHPQQRAQRRQQPARLGKSGVIF